MTDLAAIWKDLDLWLATYSEYARVLGAKRGIRSYLIVDDLAVLYGPEIDDHFPGARAITLLYRRVEEDAGKPHEMDEATITRFDEFHRSLPMPKMVGTPHPAALEMLREMVDVMRQIERLERN